MASYQVRKRDPLLDSNTQAVIEKRSKELLGFVLIALGVVLGAMVWSYTPNDPSWISATDAPVQNWLGQSGASGAATLMMIVGKGAWMFPLALAAWGLRFVLHHGHERASSRAVFTPIAVVVASLYAATLVPGANWPPNFGLGGLFGDTVLGVTLQILIPLGAPFALKLLSFFLALCLIIVTAFSLGFVKEEIRAGIRFMFLGVVMVYALLLRGIGQGAAASAKAASGMTQTIVAKREQSRAHREAIAMAAHEEAAMFVAPTMPVPPSEMKLRPTSVVRAHAAAPMDTTRKMPPMSGDYADEHAVIAPEPVAEPMFAAPVREVAPQPTGFLAGLLKRNAPEPVVEDVLAAPEDRVSARIADAVRSRKGPAPVTDLGTRIEPSLTKGRGPQPMILNTTPSGLPPLPIDAPMMDAGFMDAPIDDPVIEKLVEIARPVRQVLQRNFAPVQEPGAEPELERVEIPVQEPKKVVQHPLKRVSLPSKQALRESQPALPLEDNKYANFEMPPLSLLRGPETIERFHLSDEALEENARMLESVLDDYGVKGEIVSVRPGPVVTMYELEPAAGLKASRVIGLADDIARSMSALSARVSTIPGRSVIGIELPNEKREMVVLREMLSARDFGDSNMMLPLALGKDIGGEPVIANLAKMPHLLIAGTTGSGKSVAINTMILSLLYKLSPEDCRMIMIDPKMLELSVYDGIPHLLSPVVTDPKKAVVALKWVVGEMEERYRKMSKMGVRNIDGYNGRVRDALGKEELFSRTVQTGFDDETGDPTFETEEFKPEVLPYIVVVVDEMADLMMVAGKEIEACIQRLAQMARASGIHLIMATQRPSVDVITGTIKANFPTRISFQVTSKIDSRTILGEMGAEQLLGMGDMLYMAGGGKISRIHGPFCSDEEVEEIVNHLKGFGPPEYMSGVIEGPEDGNDSAIDLVLGLGAGSDSENALYDTAVAIVLKDRKCSTSYIQRKLAIGYNKAARLVEQMEDEGVVSSANHVGKREILVPEQN
jgi:S-DNA-T family DNA segregation ATPase FtsK/SpoIIIE